jgi:hypothetical protein
MFADMKKNQMANLNKQILTATSLYLVLFFFNACKDKSTPPSETEFTFTATDSLVFEHCDTLPILVTPSCALNKEFGVNMTDLASIFSTPSNSLITNSNTSASFDIRLSNTTNVVPGKYSCNIITNITNENSTPKNKSVKIIYRPNCAYNYIGYVNGNITYIINGIQVNKSITCTYTSEGYLKILNLSNAGSIELKMNCASNTATIVPKTINGNYCSGSAQLAGNQINLQIYSNGTLNANAVIMP